MEVKITRVAEVSVLAINEAKATLTNAVAFRDILNKTMDAGSRKIIVDLSAVNFVDSTFLGVIVIAMKRLHTVGGVVCLSGGNETIKKMLEITMLGGKFLVADDLKSALELMVAR